MPPSSLRPHRRHRVSLTPPDCRQTSTHSICSGNTHTQTLILAFPLTFHHISFVVAVIVAVRGPVVDVEALDRSVVVTRGTILHGGEIGEKKKKRLRLGCSNLPWQLLYKREEIFQQLMAGLVISRCTRLGSKMVIALSVLKVRDIMRVTEVR